jgi:hypothetical protein
MADETSSRAPTGPVRQTGEVSLWLGRQVGFDIRVRLTARGILAIGGLVSSILLSTAVLVAVSVREGDS